MIKFNQKIRLLSMGFIMVVCLAAQPTVAMAQIPPAARAQVNAELQKRGLTESEVQARLLQEGINLESIPPAQLPQYQGRVIAILDKMQAEKRQANTGGAASQQPVNINIETTPETTGTVPAAINAAEVPVEPVTTPEEAAAEASQRVAQKTAAAKKTNIYGHSLFLDKSLEVFRTTDGADAPDTYILGDGDEIRISIFGASQTDIQQRIASDGSIQPTGVAKIFLKGLSLAQARNVVRERLSMAYSFRDDQFAVSIVTARTIMVNIFGETRITGGFTVSALNSAINALSAAGGPTEIGSVRSIQLIRGSSRKTIDLYKFMSDPTVQFGFDLQNNDIIFVPVLKTLVSIEGAVNRPMDYELLPNETLNDLIKYAGGLKMNVFPDFVQIRRFVNGEERLLEFKLNEVVSGKIAVPLMNGDDVRIRSINKPLDQYVEISGSVYYPGRFDLSSNKSLLALLNNAQPDFYAKTDVVFVERVRPDETVEVLTVPYPGYNGAPDFDLRERDKVRILSQSDYRDVANISVSGFVRVPFEKTFSLNDRLTVNQAIELAGGLKTGAYPVAYILRRNLLNPVELQYIRIELASEGEKLLQPGDQLITFSNTTFTNLGEISVQGSVRNPFSRTFAATDRLNVKQAIEIAGGIEPTAYPVAYIFRRNLFNPEEVKYIRIELEEAEQIQLQPGDQLNIYDNTLFTNIGEVRVSGAVKNPRSFTYDATLSLHDVLTNAGGLNVGAAFNRVEVFRTVLSPTEKASLDLITLEVDSNYQLVSPAGFVLQPYDHIVVRMTPEFTMGRYVEITGQVRYPGVYVLESKQTRLSDVIEMAGGLLRDADPYGARLFRTYRNRGDVSINIRDAMRHTNSNNKNPIMFEGDVININRLENTVTILENGTRMSMYSIHPDDFVRRNVVFKGRRSAAYYIRNYAGGFHKEADRNSVTVTLPNNEMRSTKRFLFIRNYPTVESGSTIAILMKPPKDENQKEKKSFDWDAAFSRTLSAATSALTLYLLVDRMSNP